MVSAHYLGHASTFWVEIWYVGLSWEYTGQFLIWFQQNNFWPSYAPSTYNILLIHGFRSLSQLWIDIFDWNSVCRFIMRIHLSNLNLVPVRVMPLGLRKFLLIHVFRSLCQSCIDTLIWNSIYRFIMRVCRLNLIWVLIK